MRDDHGWIQSFSGGQLWPLDPQPEDFRIEDIAHSLALTNRYHGHTREPYSVAQHSVLVSYAVPPEHALWGLMHDAAECCIGDLARPWKRALCVRRPSAHYDDFEPVKRLEQRILYAIAVRFALPWPMPEGAIEAADLVLLATERRDLMATPPRPWVSTENVTPLAEPIVPLPWRMAELVFLSRFKELVAHG